MAHECVTLRDGRQLEIMTSGDPSGRTVVFHHGTPGWAGLGPHMAEAFGNNIVVSYSRAGYGSSARHAGRTVSSVVDDVRQVLDHLGRQEYISVGWSGGGPHALACAALDAPRCQAAISLAGVVPMDVDFDWTAGMAPENIEEFAVAREGGPRYEEHMQQAADTFANVTADTIFDAFGELLPQVDRDAINNGMGREAFADDCRHAFENGYWGFYDDDRAFFAEWGFDPRNITVPVAIWFGDADTMVPATHGEWLAKNVPGATRHFHAGDGHCSIVENHKPDLATQVATLGR